MERRRFLYSALAAASLAAIPAARSSAAATTTARREGSAPMTPSQRQNPMSCNGMVTSPHYLASQAGLDILRRGGTAGCTMNGANEVAVAAFLGRKCAWLDIVRAIEYALGRASFAAAPTLGDYAEANDEARRLAAEYLAL